MTDKPKICKRCMRYIKGYCYERDKDVPEDGHCDEFTDRTYADWLCKLVCPAPEFDCPDDEDDSDYLPL